MKEIKAIKKAQARESYEPVRVRVVKVTPQGVLCQSGGSVDDAAMTMEVFGRYDSGL